MRICKAVWGALLCSVFLVAGSGETAENKLSGVMFADYYYIASGANKEENGFLFRRIYLTHDLVWNDVFSGRVRFEAADASGQKMEPFVKHAYVRYKKNRHALYMGLSGTPTWNVSESVWGYRSVEKTIMDLNKIASSADIGLAYHARLDEDGKVNAQVMLANGNGQNSESDNKKKIYGLLHFQPGVLQMTVYADWEKRAGNRDRTTGAVFVGLTKDRFRAGLEGFVQVRKDPAGDVQARGISLFGATQLGEKVSGFARSDLFDPSDKTGNDRIFFFLGGLDFEVAKDIHIMPNVYATSFQASGVDTEVVPRVTLYAKF